MKRFILSVALLEILLWGCARWVIVGGKYVATSENYEVDLPNGWRKQNLNRDFLRVTKDGINLQEIAVGRWPVDKDPPHTKRKFATGMLPQEVAELVIDDFRSNTGLMGYEVTENSPSNVGGYRGFKVMYRYQTKSGLKKRGAYYGVLLDKWLYYLYYEAPERYYFANDYEVFERIKESFRIAKGG